MRMLFSINPIARLETKTVRNFFNRKKRRTGQVQYVYICNFLLHLLRKLNASLYSMFLAQSFFSGSRPNLKSSVALTWYSFVHPGHIPASLRSWWPAFPIITEGWWEKSEKATASFWLSPQFASFARVPSLRKRLPLSVVFHSFCRGYLQLPINWIFSPFPFLLPFIRVYSSTSWPNSTCT